MRFLHCPRISRNLFTWNGILTSSYTMILFPIAHAEKGMMKRIICGIRKVGFQWVKNYDVQCSNSTISSKIS